MFTNSFFPLISIAKFHSKTNQSINCLLIPEADPRNLLRNTFFFLIFLTFLENREIWVTQTSLERQYSCQRFTWKNPPLFEYTSCVRRCCCYLAAASRRRLHCRNYASPRKKTSFCSFLSPSIIKPWTKFSKFCLNLR